MLLEAFPKLQMIHMSFQKCLKINIKILVDLNDEITFADALVSLQNELVRKDLIKKGYRQLESINAKRSLAKEKFINMLTKYQTRSQCWS